MSEEGMDEGLSMDTPEEESFEDAPRLPDVAEEQRSRDEGGRFVASETGEAPEAQAESVAVTPTENPIPDDQFKGYLTEKRKRQELEQQVAAMQQQLSAQTQQQPTEFFDNPNVALEEFGEKLLERFEQRQVAQRLDASEAKARSQHADFDDALQSFQQAVQANPALAQQMARADDPAQFVYQTGKRAMELAQVGSIEQLLKAERAKWEAEVKAAMPRPSFPTTTAMDQSVAGRGPPVWSGPVNDSDILPMG